jgi:G:T/U-mismatch repair DNA glycosylase
MRIVPTQAKLRADFLFVLQRRPFTDTQLFPNGKAQTITTQGLLLHALCSFTSSASQPSPRRHRSSTDKFLEELDHFTVARDFFDRLIMEFGQERRRLVAG